MGKGKVLRIFDTKAVFDNLETGNCLLVSQVKESGIRHFEKLNCSQLPDLGVTSQVLHLESIFGFYDLLSGSYVALVVESESFVSIGSISIRKTKKILVVPLFRHGRVLSESKQKEEDRYLQLLHMSFSEHQFFFSNSNDITLSQQRLEKYCLQQPQLEPLWVKADHKFFWNRDVVSDLIKCEIDDWVVPFMSAYIEVISDCQIEEMKCTLLFISRRSRYRQGCRFVKRGLDENGCAANFVETEQIVIFGDGKLCSYVQIRGSIPVKWSSPIHMRYDPVVFIEENRAVSTEWSEKHVTNILEDYSDNIGNSSVIFINLVDNKKDQGKLGTIFKEVVDEVRLRVQPHPLTYVWFDFHHECKQKGKWKNLSNLILQVDEIFRAQRYFCKLPNGTVASWQTGIIRTNCMDNLDRTNVVQSLFARRSLILQTGKSKLLDMNGTAILETPWKSFEKVFKNCWANNANAMSLRYAGTSALKVDFTQNGKRTFKGIFKDGINSCLRYYINNFTDGIKQDSIDLMLGNFKPDLLGSSPFSVRTAQESLTSNITKIFVLLIVGFSTMILLVPPKYCFDKNYQVIRENNFTFEKNIEHMQIQFLVALSFSVVVVFYLFYKIVKKGSRIGDRLVVHPELCPESLPFQRLYNS
jgi:hypothetical protein